MKLVKRVILRNTTPGHSKFYEISIYCDGKYIKEEQNCSVVARWGRISQFETNSTQKATKVAEASPIKADSVVEALKYDKINRRGYKLYRKFDYDTPVSKPKKQPELKDRSEVSETPVEVAWWTTVPDLDRDL